MLCTAPNANGLATGFVYEAPFSPVTRHSIAPSKGEKESGLNLICPCVAPMEAMRTRHFRLLQSCSVASPTH
jgi:hypothetical protein